ncbi:MAG: BlaI/MecI/CopY family transcriptional regulator [Nanoarchaeota archaeon]
MRDKLTNFDSILSPLERDILGKLWPDKKLRVREIYDKLKIKRKLALSSVAVLLDRLHDKKIVERKIETARGGVRYIYSPKTNKKRFEASVVEKTVNKLIQSFGETATAYFEERFAKKK